MAASFWIRSVSGVTVPALVSVFEPVVLEVVWQQVFAPACMFGPVALEKLWQLPSVRMPVFCPSLVCISSASGLGGRILEFRIRVVSAASLNAPFTSIIDGRNARKSEQQRVKRRKMCRI